MIDLLDPASQNLMNRSAPKFQYCDTDGIVVNLICNQLKSQNRSFSRTNLHCRAAIRKRIAILQFRFQTIKWHEFLCVVYNFGANRRHTDGDEYPDIRLAVAQGTLLWQPVKFGRCSQTSPGTTFTICSGVRQRI